MSAADGPRRASRPFRWQALLQRAADAVFVLDRRRRLLFVNDAWQRVTGLPADQARGLHCRRPRPVGPEAPLEEWVAHALTPPPEALRGQPCRARRLFARPPGPPAWWDVEFQPVRLARPDDAHGDAEPGPDDVPPHLLLGRVLPRPAEHPGAAAAALLPERLMALRQKRAEWFHPDLLTAGDHPAARRLAQQARLLAAAPASVPALITGGPGSGKRTLARVVHQLSAARDRAFLALDCRRLPAAAVAAVLEHQLASAGTLYLREPAALPRDLQARVAERFTAGDGGGAPSLPRLLVGCTSPPAPADEVRAGRLHEGLYWALAAFVVEVPPLRERAADLPALAERLLGQPVAASPEAWELLRGHGWPGNLTELRRVLLDAREHAGKGGRVEPAHLPAAMRLAQRMQLEAGGPADRPIRLEAVLEEAERRLVRLALRRAEGNRARAAELLGVSRARLLRRIEALGLAEKPGDDSGANEEA